MATWLLHESPTVEELIYRVGELKLDGAVAMFHPDPVPALSVDRIDRHMTNRDLRDTGREIRKQFPKAVLLQFI